MTSAFLDQSVIAPARDLTARDGSVVDPKNTPPSTPAAGPVESDNELQSVLAAAASLVERIRGGDREALEALYRIFWKGIRFQMFRVLGSSDLDDRVHDTFLIVVQAIRAGELREPERLLGFIRTIVRRQIAYYVGRDPATRAETDNKELVLRSSLDWRESPEESAMASQNEAIVQELLQSLPERDREVLVRFYLQEQSQELICREMGLTDTQYRLLKSRAKARLAELGRRRVSPNTVDRILLKRKAASSST